MVRTFHHERMSGVTRGKKVGFLGPFFLTVTQLLGFLSYNLETVTGNSPIDEDWRNAFGILMCMEICDGAGAGICDGAPSTYSSFIYFCTRAKCCNMTEHAFILYF